MSRAVLSATLPFARPTIAGLLGVGLIAPSPPNDAAAPTEELVVLDRSPPTNTETLIVLDQTAGDDLGATVRRPPAAKFRRLLPPDQPSPIQNWVVEPGEHLWAIAETHLGETLGRSPTVGEVTSYWLAIIEHNRDRLPDPADPDLLVPGLSLELPSGTDSPLG